MGKSKPPNGLYRESIHDGSSVTLSQLRVAPRDGMGNHSKSVEKRIKRHKFFQMIQQARNLGQHEAIPNILAIYRGEFKTGRI